MLRCLSENFLPSAALQILQNIAFICLKKTPKDKTIFSASHHVICITKMSLVLNNSTDAIHWVLKSIGQIISDQQE